MENKTFVLKTSHGEILCKKTVKAETAVTRMKGLMFSKEIPGGDGFLIKPCNSIHTCFMLYPIDVVFLDNNMKVVKVIENLRPWRMTWMYWKATQTLELRGGHLKKFLNHKLQVGDQLEALCIN